MATNSLVEREDVVAKSPDCQTELYCWLVYMSCVLDIVRFTQKLLTADEPQTAAVVASRADQKQRRIETIGLLDPFIGAFPSNLDTRQRRDVKLDTAITTVTQTLDIPALPLTFNDTTFDPTRTNFTAGRAYARERRLCAAVSEALSRYVTPALVDELARNPE